MSITNALGSKFSLTLTTGQRIEAQLTFGDFARAEAASGINFVAAIQQQGDVGLADIARLCYEAAYRTHQYTATYDEWLNVLDSFPDIEVPEGDDENTEATVRPFPEARPAIS